MQIDMVVFFAEVSMQKNNRFRGTCYRFLCLFLFFVSQACSQEHKDIDKFLAALSKVESYDNDNAVGDKGKALGRYQIHKAYWKDSKIPGNYEQVVDPAYARKVVLAYFRRYAKDALTNGDWEILARIHNGGPSIMSRQGSKAWDNTSAYWAKIKVALDTAK